MTHRAESTTLRPAYLGAMVGLIVVTAVVWRLAGASPTASTPCVVRVWADGAAVCALGFAVVPFLASGVLRADLAARAARPLAVASALWLIAEMGRLGVMAGQAAGLPLTRVPLSVLRLYATQTDPGRANVVAVVFAAAVCLMLAVGVRSASRAVVCLVAAGLASRALSGHLAHSPLGMAAVASHAVAAGVWCGALVGLLVTVRHRSVWARVLPAYSGWALICVAVLLASGSLGALLVIGPMADVFVTPYGRVLLVKVALAAVLVAMGWRNRVVWVPAARARTVGVNSAGRRAVREVAVMAAALVVAAILSLTA